MSITLANGATTLALPDDLDWPDEYAHRPVSMAVGFTLTGRAHVESVAYVTGRTITLQADQSSAWMTRATLDTLKTWEAVAGLVLVLTLRGVARNVMFDSRQSPGAEGRPIIFYSDPATGDYYVSTLRFLTV